MVWIRFPKAAKLRRLFGVLWPVASVMEQDDHGGRMYLYAVHRVPPASFAGSGAVVLFVVADEDQPYHPRFLLTSRRHSLDTVFVIDSKLD